MSITAEDIYYHIRLPLEYKDFWVLNAEFSYLEPFATFKKKKDSAKIMVAIYMIYDPKSELVNSGTAESQIKKDISKNFLDKEKFDWNPYMTIVRAYKIYCKTKIEKSLDSWWYQLQEREIFIKEDMEWESNPKEKDEMLLKTKQHYENYHQIVSSLKEERQEMLMHGDYTPSELELWSIVGK